MARFILATSLFHPTFSACSFDATTGTSQCDTYIQWTDSEGGAVAWAKDCDFVGYDMTSVESPDHSCGKLCLSSRKCTHFTWRKGVCFIKSHVRKQAEEPNKSLGDICGFIPQRTDFVRVGK